MVGVPSFCDSDVVLSYVSCQKDGQIIKLVDPYVIAQFVVQRRCFVMIEDRWCGRGNKVEAVSGRRDNKVANAPTPDGFDRGGKTLGAGPGQGLPTTPQSIY